MEILTQTQTKIKTRIMKNAKQEVTEYLNKTSKHVFIINDEHLMKVVEHEGEWYILKEDNYRKLNANFWIDQYGRNAKNVISDIIFPPHGSKRRAIRQTKNIKTKINEMMKQLPSE